MLKRVDWFVLVAALMFAVGCGGGGCGGCAGFQPIPGGFPAAKREANAAQIRLSSNGIGKITADPGKLVSGVIGGPLEFNVPGSCGTLDICCPNGNTPSAMCGPIALNLDNFAGMNGARLEMNPQVPNRLQVVIRTRIKTVNKIPASGFGIDCDVDFNSERSGQKDLEIIAPITFGTDPTAGTTRVTVGDLTINRLEEDDFSITGDFLCGAADWGIQYFLGPIKDAIAGPVRDAVEQQTCKACPSGDVGECGTFATACTDNVCMIGDRCMQELGISGRASGGALFGSLSPGTTGAMDIYEVSGGDGEAVNAGMSLFLFGGMQPGGTARDRCGPPATDPGVRGVPRSAIFRGNSFENQNFDFGIGIHKNQLDQLAYAAYDGGMLCLTLSSNTVAQLNTDTLSLVSRSLGNLNEGNAPMAVGLRPQSPPVFTLGRNVFTDDGMGNVTLTEPLLDVKFTGLELDFFAAVDEQWIRVFTVVADVQLPIGLQVTASGEIGPVLGDVNNAFTNISVKNSEAVTESPAELAALFPSVLNLVLPQLSGALSPIALPSFAGLTITPTAITSVENNSFLAIFANLTLGMMPAPVQTTAVVADVTEAPESVARRPSQWKGAQLPSVTLELGGSSNDLEYSYRIDRGTWSAWSKNARPTVASSVFWLPGTHRIEVRARQTGLPHTIDESPVQLDVEMGSALLRSAPARPFHGQPGEAGCNCSTSSDPAAALPLALVVGLVLVPLRRVRRKARRLKKLPLTSIVLFVTVALMASLPGCSCGSNPCGDVDCLPGEVTHGGLGRWTSIAADDTRVLVATYDQGLGDLLVIDVTDPAAQVKRAIDGVPTDVTPVYDPSGYRGGIEEPGPNVGAWNSIAISEGLAKVAYQDRDTGALKFAHETAKDKWETYTLQTGDNEGEEIGRYAHMIIDSAGHAAIAYISTGNDDGSGHRITELRIARAGEKTPGEADWNQYVAATGIGSCGGLCGAGEACIDKPEGQTCAVVTADCAATCANTEACVAGACTPKYDAPAFADLPMGAGLFASLVQLPDGRLAAAYYDRGNRALAIAVESAAGSNEYVSTRLHEGAGDRGLWASAVVDGGGTVHVAYQDAISDMLLYTTFTGVAGAVEVVDDGTRAGEFRAHNVGAGAQIYLVGGAPVIAYQDGLTSDVMLASRNGAGAWTSAPLSTGPLLDGFSIGVATHAGKTYFAWDRLDPAISPPNSVFVQAQ